MTKTIKPAARTPKAVRAVAAPSAATSKPKVLTIPDFTAEPAAFSRVLAAFNRGPLRMQRNHSERALKVQHIGKALSGDQKIFHMVIWQGQERLIDGYTRVERIIQGLTQAPEAVLAIVHVEPSTETELIALYDQFNSKAALKGSEDRYQEGLRMASLMASLKSPLVLKGQRSAGRLATGVGSIRDGVLAAEAGIRFVDNLLLTRRNESLGVLAAYYAIGLHSGFCADKAEEFIRKVNQVSFVPRLSNKGDFVIDAFRDWHDKKKAAGSATGGSNIDAIRNQALAAFVAYAGLESFLPSTDVHVTLAVFNEVVRKARLATGTK